MSTLPKHRVVLCSAVVPTFIFKNKTSMPTQEWTISGKVQGVFYRASARQKAETLGLTGWVKNLPDGSVQLRATGPDGALAAMEAWCKVGPPGARVTEVQAQMLPEENFDGFRIIR